MAAPISKLGTLHEKLTDIMLEECTMYSAEGIPMPSSDKAAIAKFLKDNNVTADPADQADLEALRDRLLGKQELKRTALAAKLESSGCNIADLYDVH